MALLFMVLRAGLFSQYVFSASVDRAVTGLLKDNQKAFLLNLIAY